MKKGSRVINMGGNESEWEGVKILPKNLFFKFFYIVTIARKICTVVVNYKEAIGEGEGEIFNINRITTAVKELK